jgi:hypothetical protein
MMTQKNDPLPALSPIHGAAGRSAELDTILVKGAREHNLQNIDIELPKKKLIVFTGVSGLGQIEPGLRHHFRRGPAPLRGVAVGLCPPVHRSA